MQIQKKKTNRVDDKLQNRLSPNIRRVACALSLSNCYITYIFFHLLSASRSILFNRPTDKKMFKARTVQFSVLAHGSALLQKSRLVLQRHDESTTTTTLLATNLTSANACCSRVKCLPLQARSCECVWQCDVYVIISRLCVKIHKTTSFFSSIEIMIHGHS